MPLVELVVVEEESVWTGVRSCSGCVSSIDDTCAMHTGRKKRAKRAVRERFICNDSDVLGELTIKI